jgi:hypothetical protein
MGAISDLFAIRMAWGKCGLAAIAAVVLLISGFQTPAHAQTVALPSGCYATSGSGTVTCPVGGGTTTATCTTPFGSSVETCTYQGVCTGSSTFISSALITNNVTCRNVASTQILTAIANQVSQAGLDALHSQ